jgi:penicillin G amidase
LRPIFSHIFGLLILIIIVLVTVGILFNSLTKKSYYPETGTIKVNGISQRVNIYKSELGVPHIFAENEDDLYFSLGYVHAQDRLWQMDLTRRVAEGKLSEILGPDVLDYDILFRTIGIDKVSYLHYENSSPETKSISESYTRGVNAFIDEHISNLPLEFDILNYKPEPWKPEHSFMIVRMMGWELNLSWFAEIMIEDLVNKFGLERAKDLIPSYNDDGPFIIGARGEDVKKDSVVRSASDTLKKTSEKKDQNKKSVTEKNKPGTYLKELKNFFDIADSFRNFRGHGSQSGSNSWVVSGEKTESGKPMIANDPHLSLQVPAKWYEVHLYNNKNDNSISGFSIPGVPGIAIGHNNSIAWALTNLMNDDSDFLILDKDTNGNGKYIYGNSVIEIDSTTEGIKIKGKNDEYNFTRYSTKIGPVIFDLERTGFNTKRKINFNVPEKILVYKWTGYEKSDEIESFYKINHANNWNEFLIALRSYGTPALSFLYADTSGNIGYHAAGYIPVRKNLTDESFAYFPSNNVSWSGFIPFAELPNSYNPREGFLVTANNKPGKNYNHYISYLFEPHYRSERISDFLKNRNALSVEDFKLIQRDVFSLQAKEFCGYIFDTYREIRNPSDEEKLYLDILRNWDYEMRIYSYEAAIFAQFEIELYKNLYKDLLGEELFENYIFMNSFPVKTTSKILRQNNSWIFDRNNPGNSKQRKSEIIRKSFSEAISNLKIIFGTNDYTKWFWGDIHQIEIKHPLGIVPELSTMLNIGPFKAGGNGTTVSVAQYSFNNALRSNSFHSQVGSSMRMIIDLEKIKESYTIIPTGQSGQALHPNFKDQARLWMHYNYKEVSTDFEDLKKENLKLLVLEPGK